MSQKSAMHTIHLLIQNIILKLKQESNTELGAYIVLYVYSTSETDYIG